MRWFQENVIFLKMDVRRLTISLLTKIVKNKKINVNELELISLHIIDIFSTAKWFQLFKKL